MDQMPVTILGGYLGCGKTTLVNHLLHNANGLRIAVLVNDFGELPIDASLIETEKDNIINLSGGCVCCSYGNDLSMAIMQILDLPEPPQHVLIESSGVALPGQIRNSLSLFQQLTMEGVLVLADASTIRSNAADRYIGDTITRQLDDADIVLLNKLDLVDHNTIEDIKRWLSQDFEHCQVLTTSQAKIPLSVALGTLNQNAGTGNNKPGHDHSATFSSTVLKPDKTVDARVLAERLASSKAGIVRAKGFVQDLDDEIKTIQVVGSRWSVDSAPANAKVGIVCIAAAPELDVENLRLWCGL